MSIVRILDYFDRGVRAVEVGSATAVNRPLRRGWRVGLGICDLKVYPC